MTSHIHMERRIEKRTYLKHACAFTIIIDSGLIPFDEIELTDMSKDGLAFTLYRDFGSFEAGETLSSRLYLNSFKIDDKRFYIPLNLLIINATDVISNQGAKVRYGCTVSSEDLEFKKMLKHFINFIDTSQNFIKEDKGDYFISTTIA